MTGLPRRAGPCYRVPAGNRPEGGSFRTVAPPRTRPGVFP
jgi:hypothetical protein